MKYLILLSTLLALSAHAWEPIQPYGGQYLSNDEALYGGLGLGSYNAYEGTTTRRNIFGGQDIHRPGYSPITTIPNVFGGQNYYGGYPYNNTFKSRRFGR